MTSQVPGAASLRSLPGPADILEQLEAALVVTGVDGNLLYANPFAVRLFGFPDDAAHLVGRSLASLGFEEGDAPRVSNLVTHVVRGSDTVLAVVSIPLLRATIQERCHGSASKER